MCPLDRRHRSWNLALHLQGWFFHWHYPKDPLQDQVWQDSTSKEGVHAKQGKHGYLHWWIFKIEYFQPTKPCKKTLQCYKSTQTSIPLSDDVGCRCMIKKQDYFINAHPSCRKAFLIKKTSVHVFQTHMTTSTTVSWLFTVNVASSLLVNATAMQLSIVKKQTRKHHWRQSAIPSNTSVLGDGSRSSEEWLATSDPDALLSLSGLWSTAACSGLPNHPR